MKRVAVMVLAFIGGMLAGYVASFAAYVAYTSLTDYHDREGAAAMGVAFVIGPVVGLCTGLLAAIWAARRGR